MRWHWDKCKIVILKRERFCNENQSFNWSSYEWMQKFHEIFQMKLEYWIQWNVWDFSRHWFWRMGNAFDIKVKGFWAHLSLEYAIDAVISNWKSSKFGEIMYQLNILNQLVSCYQWTGIIFAIPIESIVFWKHPKQWISIVPLTMSSAFVN